MNNSKLENQIWKFVAKHRTEYDKIKLSKVKL